MIESKSKLKATNKSMTTTTTLKDGEEINA